VVAVIGTGPRSGSTSGSASAQQTAKSKPSARTKRDVIASHLDDLDRALLEVGLERDRVGGVERQLVDQLAGVEPGHEDETARRLVAVARLDARAHAAAARAELDQRTAAHAELGRVVRMHVAD